MLSWALKRNNTDAARDAPGPDDTLIEQPDTPAPVFAMRAFKTALFGTPAPRVIERPSANDKPGSKNTNPASLVDRSPMKPPTGILLTPGTGTTRRKRVSFGHDVKAGSAVQATSVSGLPDECPGKFPSPWVNKSEDKESARPKTRLTEVLENARTTKPKTASAETQALKETEDAWEEVEDDESDRDFDATVDLNEPHSRSGKYWKSYFETYHADAKAEMEKLVKYKQLAKSYAKMKDAEAGDLNQKLKEEQEKVKLMEKRVAEMGRHVESRAKKNGGEYDTKLTDELARQTALAQEYKQQVEELEALLQPEDDDTEDRLPRQRRIASPRTHKTLLETQRELRRARSQVKELDKLREDRDRLRSELRFAEQRANKLAIENKKLSTELSHSAPTIRDLEKKLAESREESISKDNELKKLRADYDKLKEDAKARYTEAHQVLQNKNGKISELQDEIGSLRTGGAESRWAASAKSLEAKLKAGSEKIKAPDRETALKFLQTAEEESTQLLQELQELRKASIERGLIAPTPSARAKQRARASTSTESLKRDRHADDQAPVSSRALREKIDTDLGRRSSTVLSDRGNLQDSRSSASSGASQQVSAHRSREEPAPRHSRVERAPSRTALPRSITTKSSIDEIMDATRAHASKALTTTTAAATAKVSRKPSSRSLSREDNGVLQIDLVQDNFVRLGSGPVDAHNSSVWEMNTSRTSLPLDRRVAALARLQRKRAERARELHPERNKENMRSH
ncbi:spindle pole body formation-associated protein-domain-containing protein [Podospora appendiculata]|uniref:Spindle pole body formation-associated protein-domain-containing protein n=1 Tax=Podospora appendiculata TaxID=314037 RepID=A0AAE0X6R6_9PEZI|nr:spindle pole body formation-associated protein-domain-containing protein [Podospora appendiculata]